MARVEHQRDHVVDHPDLHGCLGFRSYRDRRKRRCLLMSVRLYCSERGGLKNPVRGCCALDYRGYVISISTIAEPHEVLVFHKETKDNLFTDYGSAEGVKRAMERIDEEIDT
jgi:hypothetical protein